MHRAAQQACLHLCLHGLLSSDIFWALFKEFSLYNVQLLEENGLVYILFNKIIKHAHGEGQCETKDSLTSNSFSPPLPPQSIYQTSSLSLGQFVATGFLQIQIQTGTLEMRRTIIRKAALNYLLNESIPKQEAFSSSISVSWGTIKRTK